MISGRSVVITAKRPYEFMLRSGATQRRTVSSDSGKMIVTRDASTASMVVTVTITAAIRPSEARPHHGRWDDSTAVVSRRRQSPSSTSERQRTIARRLKKP